MTKRWSGSTTKRWSGSMPISDTDKRKIIDWITCDGQAKGIMEDGEVDEDLTRDEIEHFILELRGRLNIRK